jgi:hypothetical protein
LLLIIVALLLGSVFALTLTRFPLDGLQRSCAAALLSLLALVYAPQLANSLFSSLTLAAQSAALGLLTLVCALASWHFSRRLSADRVAQSALAEAMPCRSPYLISLTAAALLASGASLWISTQSALFGWDGWAYHSPAMAWFHQHDAIAPMPLMEWIIGYPKNIEFLSLWSFLLEGDDTFIDTINLALHWLTVPFAYGVGRHVGLKRGWALAGALLYFLTPTLMAQTWRTYIDQAFADSVVIMLYVLFTWLTSAPSRRTGWLVLLGCTLGHLAQTKGTGLHMVLIIGLWVVVAEARSGRLRQLPRTLLILALPTALLGAGWYLHTWWVMGNPLYPFRITLPGSGSVLFEGRFDLKDSMLQNLGQGIDLSAPLPLVYLRQFAFSGWGLQFFALGLPAMLLVLLKGHGHIRALAIFAVVYLLVTPFSFVDRYAVVVTFPAAVSFAYVMQHWIGPKRWMKTLAALSAGAVILSLVPAFKELAPRAASERNPPAHDAFASTEGFRRFALVTSSPTAQHIGLVDLALGADNPHWYFYFGPRWQNQVSVFDKAHAGEFDFAVCAQQLGRCGEIAETGLFARVLEENTVEVWRRVRR